MPTNVTVGSNYAGKVAGAIIGASFQEADTIRLGLVTFAQNINYKLNMRRIRLTNGRQAYSCGHDPQGSVVLDERVLEPVKLKNDLDVCKEDFRATYNDGDMGASAHNKDFLGSDILEAIETEVLAQTAVDTDILIWSGDANNTDEWDGFETLFAADDDVIKPAVPAGIGALAEATVVAHLKAALSAIPRALRRKAVNVAVAPDVFQAYWFTLVTKGLENDGNTAPKRIGFGKYMLTECNGLSDTVIAIYEKGNLVFGTGLLGDHNELALVDEDKIGLLTGKVRGKMVYNGGCQYYNSEDIVFYKAVAA